MSTHTTDRWDNHKDRKTQVKVDRKIGTLLMWMACGVVSSFTSLVALRVPLKVFIMGNVLS